MIFTTIVHIVYLLFLIYIIMLATFGQKANCLYNTKHAYKSLVNNIHYSLQVTSAAHEKIES